VEVDVVQGRPRGRDRGDGEPSGIERREDRRDRVRAVRDACPELPPLDGGLAGAVDRRHRVRRLLGASIESGELDGDRVAAQRSLQLLRPPLHDDTAAAHDRDPLGQPVGLL
jgi:hypothetical protein